MEEKEQLLENENKYNIIVQKVDTFSDQNICNKFNNKNSNKLTAHNIKKEIKKSAELKDVYSQSNQNIIIYNILKLIIIILVICFIFFFRKQLINLKIKYLSDKSLFKYNIFYSDPSNSFLIFIIIISCITIASGLKLLLFQIFVYILTFLIIILKNKKFHLGYVIQKDKVIFHCSDIFISFSYLGEKIIGICKEHSLNNIITITLIIFNISLTIYFILVEIINCQYEEIITDIIYGIIVSIFVYFLIYYIMKYYIRPKRIISIIIGNIILSFIITVVLTFNFFFMCFFSNKIVYFFASKIISKFIGVLSFIIFEIYFLLRDRGDKKFQFYFLYNVYSNKLLYSQTNIIKTIIRVILSIIIEHFLLSKLDITVVNNDISFFKCLFIILLDVLHGFLILFMIKIIFILMHLNNSNILDLSINSHFMRYGSFTDAKEDEPLFIIEKTNE